MGNIVRFPRSKRALPVPELDVEEIRKPRAATAKAVFVWLFRVLRLFVFWVMYWLRLPVIGVCNLVSVPTLLAWLFSLYAFPDKTAMVWGFGIVSFTAFVVSWVYDFILMMLSPQDMMKSL